LFHIFDIDNTLFFTNELNNKAYIFALSSLGLEALAPCKRITRTVVSLWYPFLTDEDLTAIVRLKQIYVNENLHLVSINNDLYRLLQEIERIKVGLWTAADPSRIQNILDYTGITNYTYIRFSDKSQEDICHGIQEFCHIFKCEKDQLCFYEDDKNVISLLKSHNVQVVEVLV
jgi:hypothetical protein